MDCALESKPGSHEVREPVAPYYIGGGGSAVAEADWGGAEDEPMTPEMVAAIRRDPEFIVWKEGIIRRLYEGAEDVKAGRVRPFKDAMRDFWQKVENGEL